MRFYRGFIVVFFPKCKSLMFPKGDIFVCGKCEFEQKKAGSSVVVEKQTEKETVLLEKKIDILPKTRVECPKCGHKFPFFAAYSRRRIWRGLLCSARYECPDCETTSRQKSSWRAWLFSFMALLSVIAMFRNIPYFVELRQSHSGVYGSLGGLVIGLILGFGPKIGSRLVPLSEV